jgi:iron complex transport system permease protein
MHRLSLILGFILTLSLGISLLVGTLSLDLLLKDSAILWDLRVPRTLIAVAMGVSLGLTGAVLQGFLRNPLAEPGIMGVSSAAAFGAVLVMTLGFGNTFLFTVPLAGMAGVLGVTFFLYNLLKKNPNPLTLILTGLALNSLLGALMTLTLTLSHNPYASLEIIFWLLGSFAHHSLEQAALVIPLSILGWVVLWRLRFLLDTLSLGEEMAIVLGASPKKMYSILILGVALSIGPLVSLVGVVGFIGLLVPHMVRPFVNHKPSDLLLPSALGGGIMALTADILVRLASSHMDLKVGVLTSLMGTPFFLYLLLKQSRVSHATF